jgi:hypothetical protein
MKTGYWVTIDADELDAFYSRVDNHQLLEDDYPTISTITKGYVAILQALESKEISISRLRRIIFGASTEKTEKVLGDDDADAKGAKDDDTAAKKPREKPKGHGRKSASEYEGANRIPLPHETLQHGCGCPTCGKGKIYTEAKPRLKIWITGSAPLNADCYEREALRCNLCGETFVAELPEEIGDDKYDESAVSSLALLKYGTGMPFYRLEKFQESLGIPLPASTQWDLVYQAADRVQPAYAEMLRLAAQGQLFFTDDTGMKLLESPEVETGPEETETVESTKPRAVFTTGIVSVVDGHKVAVYSTNRKHAGESFADLLQRRAEDLATPIQMSDGLSRNIPKEFKTILANCLVHGRRKFIDIVSSFPDEVRFVLKTLEKVYEYDDRAKEQEMSPEERLAFHQKKSQPLMDKLKDWFEVQLREKKVEPNSNLGKAIKYMLKRWEPLTLFLRVPGAPLDNNEVERILKLVVLSRKNSYYYRSKNGAFVGDLFMTIIQTCKLCRANAFDYITQLQRHAGKVYANPSAWMPWNYQDALKVEVATTDDSS